MVLKTRSSSQQMKDQRVYLLHKSPYSISATSSEGQKLSSSSKLAILGLSEESVNLVNNLRESEKLFGARIYGTEFKKCGSLTIRRVQLSIMSNGQHSEETAGNCLNWLYQSGGQG